LDRVAGDAGGAYFDLVSERHAWTSCRVKLADAYGLPRVNLAAKAVLTMVMAMTTRGILIRRKEHRRY